MAKPKWHTRWKVLPHQPLRQLEDNLQVVDAKLPGGVPLDRRMTVVRLRDGRLVVHNAIALDDASMATLEAWGQMAFLVVPNGFHRLDAFAYKQRYPNLTVIAGPRGQAKIEQAVSVDGGPELLPADGGMHGFNLDGDKVGEMAFIIEHGDTKTLLVNDAVFNQPHQPGFGGFVMRAIGSTGGLKLTRVMRVFGVSDTKAFAADVLRLAETRGVARLIMSHGDIIEGDIAGRLRAILG